MLQRKLILSQEKLFAVLVCEFLDEALRRESTSAGAGLSQQTEARCTTNKRVGYGAFDMARTCEHACTCACACARATSARHMRDLEFLLYQAINHRRDLHM